MAKKLQLKDSSSVLKVFGVGQVDNSNITHDLLERLKKLNPAYADFFEEKEIEVENKLPKPKLPKNGTDV